jgi:hypothetical protein
MAMKKDPQRALEVLIFLGLVSLLLGLAKLILSGAPNKQPQALEIERLDVTHKTGIQQEARK